MSPFAETTPQAMVGAGASALKARTVAPDCGAKGDAMQRPGLLGLCLAVLWACAPREPTVYHVERGRTYAEDQAVVWERVQRFLRESDIAVVSADPASGVIVAERREYQDAGWADCERARVIDRTSNNARPTRARPISRDLALEVTVRASAGGTEVQPLARFTEQQLNPYRNWPLTQRCRSTGMLESALLDAQGGAPASPAPPASEPEPS
jgi:hypothetical protein